MNRWQKPVAVVAVLGVVLISWGPPAHGAGSTAPATGRAAVTAESDLCAQVSHTAGFRNERLVTAVAVALAESSCNPAATNSNPPPPQCTASIDRGLFQINSCYHPEVSAACAFDPQCNANAAYRISSAGTNWTPWSVYTSGRYRAFLPEATAAVERLAPALPWRPLCYPVSGDWDGNGTDTLGVACKDGVEYEWGLMNFNGGGSAQIVGRYGNAVNCLPVTGDWDGNGTDTIGVACRSGAGMTWSLTNGFQGSPSYPVFGFGNSDNCRPVTGNWDGSGGDTIGVACKAGHGMSWAMMNFHGGGSPQITAGFGNGDSYQYSTGWPGPNWPNWPTP